MFCLKFGGSGVRGTITSMIVSWRHRKHAGTNQHPKNQSCPATGLTVPSTAGRPGTVGTFLDEIYERQAPARDCDPSGQSAPVDGAFRFVTLKIAESQYQEPSSVSGYGDRKVTSQPHVRCLSYNSVYAVASWNNRGEHSAT